MTMVGEATLGHPVVLDGTPPRLAGSRCPVCGDVRVPARRLCPNDTAECDPVPVSGEGSIYAAVRVDLAPEGFEAPYRVGYIDLADQVRVFGMVAIEDGELELAHGDRVAMTVEPVAHAEDGTPVLGPVFRRAAS